MRSLPPRLLHALACTLVPALLLPACDAFDGDRSDSNDESSESAQALAASDGTFSILRESGRGGTAPALGLLQASWGRRVDLWALDPADGRARPWLQGVVVAADQDAVAGQVVRDVSLATGRERLVVQHALGSAAAMSVLDALEGGLAPLGAGELPADAVVSLVFDDLLDASRLATGVTLALDGQVLAPAALELDSAHGVSIAGAHHSARITVELDPRTTAMGGLLELDLAGIANLAGNGLAGASFARVTSTVGAPLGGSQAPFVVGRLDGQITQVLAGPQPGLFLVQFQFASGACAFAPQLGDVFQTATHAAQVIGASAPPQGGLTNRLRVQLVQGNPLTFAPGAAQLRARWDPSLGAPAACFVTISPPPGSAPASDVSTQATITVEFSEPMLAGSVQSTGTWTLSQADPSGPLGELVPAKIAVDPSGTRFTFSPVLPLRHRQGEAEVLEMRMLAGPFGITDWVQTPLEQALPDLKLQLAVAQPSVRSDGLTFSFASADEDGDALPDLRGQVLYAPLQNFVTGRPVQRFSSVVDTSQPLVAAMNVSPIGLQNPLNPFGARQMSVWRHVDMGLGLLDEQTHNLDVEGLNWAPSQPVVSDQFSQFRMAFAHSASLPDEAVDAGLLPLYRFSGLGVTFADNLLDGLSVVHDKAMGYTISPADGFLSATGTLLQPWPLNRNVSPTQYAYWTWRDTAVVEVGGDPSAPGADPLRLAQVTGNQDLVGFYPGGQVPSIGQPLLSEFRTYPDASALGVNQLKTSFALNSSFRPTFRAYSGGGLDSLGVADFVDPDNEPVATGGYTSSGLPTAPVDNTVLWGQVDFVTRISRAHTRWLDTGAARDFVQQTVIEPGLFGLPAGTQVRLAFRGASDVHSVSGQPWLDAERYDPYGDGYTQAQLDTLLGAGVAIPFEVVEFPVDGDKGWHDSLDALDGARWVQVRLTFVANAATSNQPAMAGFALAWQ